MTRTKNETATRAPLLPAHNLEAEEALLGAALISPEALDVLIHETAPEEFYSPANAAVAGALHRLHEAGIDRPDAVIVTDELLATGELEVGGPTSRLISLMAGTPSTSNASTYARMVSECATRRRGESAASEIMDRFRDTTTVLDEVINDCQTIAGTVNTPRSYGTLSPDIDDILASKCETDWLVPGLLGRGERFILTGGEGAGKSVILRQIAVQVAAGIHPWTHQRIKPRKVLIVDVENSIPQIASWLRRFQHAAGGSLQRGNVRVESRPEGLNLLHRFDVRWLTDRVAVNKPDILVIGPIYKLHSDDPNDELPARKLAGVLDLIRTRYGCTLLIESHSPHGIKGSRDLRPFGSSLWLRWPEFGYGIRQTKDEPDVFHLDTWRGPRELRDWPARIRRGGAWPWVDASLPSDF